MQRHTGLAGEESFCAGEFGSIAQTRFIAGVSVTQPDK